MLYGFLWNGYWTPESDGAVYLSVARNLFLDHAYHFNGALPVIIPPLWPILLAGLFHLSPSFWFLNLVSTLVMIASAMIWHRILLRLTRPGRAFGIAFLSAMILEWYRLGTLPYTDPLAVLVLGVAVLLALQMQAAGRGFWRIPLLFLLVCVAVLLRYAAMLGILLVAGALVRGERRPRFHVPWLTAALCLLGGMATLVWVRCAYAWLLLHGGYGAMQAGGGVESAVANQYSLLSAPGVRQVVALGSWVTVALFAPAEKVAGIPTLGLVVPIAGWGLIACFLAALLWQKREMRWLGLSVALYVVVIAFRWSRLNTRYLVPVIPLLLLGIADGIGLVAGRFRAGATTGALPRLAVAFLVAVGIANAPLYAMSVRVARAADFYSAFRAESKQIIDIGHHLLNADVKDDEVAVTRRFFDQDARRPNHYALRSLVLLTGRRIRAVPAWFNEPQSTPEFVSWAETSGVRYLVHRPSVAVERICGLPMPRIANWFKARRGETPAIVYALYEIADGQARRVAPPDVPHWPKSVPALSSRSGPRPTAPDGGS